MIALIQDQPADDTADPRSSLSPFLSFSRIFLRGSSKRTTIATIAIIHRVESELEIYISAVSERNSARKRELQTIARY